MKPYVLDSKDRKIMYALDFYSRKPLSKIAKETHLSKEVVNYRLNRMIRSGAILHFHVIINNQRLGIKMFRVYLKLQNLGLGDEKRFYDYLFAHEKIWWIVRMTVTWDAKFVVSAKDQYEFEEVWHELLRRFRPFIAEHRITIVTRMHVFRKTVLLDPARVSRREKVMVEGRETAPHDETDLRLLRVLGTRARAPLKDIAVQIGISPKMAAYRMRRMQENGIILAYGYEFSQDALDMLYIKLVVTLQDFSVRPKMLAYVSELPNVTYIIESVGGDDVEFDIMFRKSEELDAFIQEFRQKFGASMRKHEYYRSMNLRRKRVYMP